MQTGFFALSTMRSTDGDQNRPLIVNATLCFTSNLLFGGENIRWPPSIIDYHYGIHWGTRYRTGISLFNDNSMHTRRCIPFLQRNGTNIIKTTRTHQWYLVPVPLHHSYVESRSRVPVVICRPPRTLVPGTRY